MLAWQTAHLLQPHLRKGKKITPQELLGERKQTSEPMPGIFLDKASIVDAIKAQRAARAAAENDEDDQEEA